MDYARRYAGQRRLAAAIFILIWITGTVRDWVLLNTLDPSIVLHVGYVRLAGAVGVAVPVWLMWGPRAFDERWAVRLLCAVTMSCWLELLGLVNVYPPTRIESMDAPSWSISPRAGGRCTGSGRARARASARQDRGGGERPHGHAAE